MLLADYFDELADHIQYGGPSSSKKALPLEEKISGKGESVSALVREARAFSHANLGLTYLEKKKLRGGETRNKQII